MEESEILRDRLLRARTVLIFGEIDAARAEKACAEILALANDASTPIRVVIHSPGGHVESADSIHDVIRFVGAEVRMLGTGWVASAGALIYVAVPRERRFALPNTRFLLHQPLGGVGGPASDVEIEARQILKVRERLNQIFSHETGQPLEKIEKDTERNHWLGAREALEYGLVGHIIENAEEM